MREVREIVLRDFSDAKFIENFCINDEGTLKKRDGNLLIADFDTPVRGMVSDGNEHIYVATGYDFYDITADGIRYVGPLSGCSFKSESEKCLMYIASGIVYIIGGNATYRYELSSGILSCDSVYVPVYATDNHLGELANLMTPHIREQYVSPSDGNCYIHHAFVRVCSVDVDGVFVSPDDYTISQYTSYEVQRLTLSSNIDVLRKTVTVEYETAMPELLLGRDDFLSCKKVYHYNSDDLARVLLYGSDSGKLYYSEALPIDDLGNVILGDYFPTDYVMTIDEGMTKVIELVKQNDRTLVFTKNSIYYLAERSINDSRGNSHTGFKPILINSDIGITEASGAVNFEDKIFFMNGLGLYKLSHNPVDRKYTCTSVKIPEHIGISPSRYEDVRLHLNRQSRELWCILDDVIAVYDLKNGMWYRFTGFLPEDPIPHGANTVFISGSQVCVHGMADTDCGEGFDATVRLDGIDFGNIFSKKTIYGFGVALERYEGARLECTLESDKGATFSFEVDCDNEGASSPVVKHTHARLGGVNYVSCSITSPGDAAPANVREVLLRYRIEE